MSQRFKIHKLISSAHLAELKDFASKPGRTIRDVQNWLNDRGYAVSYTGCWNWLKSFLGEDYASEATPFSPDAFQQLSRAFFKDLIGRIETLSAENAELAAKIAELERGPAASPRRQHRRKSAERKFG